MNEIANFIGHGKVRIEKRDDGREQAVLTIYDRGVLKDRILPIFEGKLHTKKKRVQFYNWKKELGLETGNIMKPATDIRIHPNWLVGSVTGRRSPMGTDPSTL